MIISDKHRFVFIHIPKCAGTSVRRALQPLDESGGAFSERVVEDPRWGRIDLTHLPLDLLADVAPEAYGRLLDPAYASYALTHDPHKRFPSALAQRLKMYRGVEMAQLDPKSLTAEVDATIRHLTREPRVTAPEYIHFARQIDFVDHEGHRLVRSIFPVDRLDEFHAAMSRRTGGSLPSFGHENRAQVMRFPALARLVRTGGYISRRLLPPGISDRVRTTARRLLLQPAQASLPAVFSSDTVREFVSDFYSADIALYNSAIAERHVQKEDASLVKL